MSGSEIVTIVFGLLVGYWIVSFFIDPPRKAISPEDEASPAPPSAPAEPLSPPWHTVLDLPPTASNAQIAAAYQTLKAQYDPEKVALLGPELRTLCEQKAREIDAAFDQAMSRPPLA